MPLGKRINFMADRQSIYSMEESNPSPVSQGYHESNSNIIKTFITFQSEKPKYSFNDIILNTDTYDAIQDVMAIYGKRELLFDKWGLGGTHKKQNGAGINLYGYPGTGKSMTAHAIANQLGRNIITVDYSDRKSVV